MKRAILILAIAVLSTASSLAYAEGEACPAFDFSVAMSTPADAPATDLDELFAAGGPTQQINICCDLCDMRYASCELNCGGNPACEASCEVTYTNCLNRCPPGC